jgi:uncharacterized protein YjbI with pentapeptide repeats
MNWSALHRLRPALKAWRRALVPLLVVVLLTPIGVIPQAQTASAQSSDCDVTSCPPPDLLNLNQPLYAPTAVQMSSLEDLENQAVDNIIGAYGLSASDTNAILSWGRADADAELYALLLQAITTSACITGQPPGTGCRTTDQQNAVDWLGTVVQRQAVAAAEDAGLEYVEWAGLDTSQYQSLLNSNASENALTAFLSGTPEDYNLIGTNGAPLAPSQYAQSAGGWCVFQAPAPDAGEYTGSTDPTCTGVSCPEAVTCNPPTPSYNQFIDWGEADASYSLLDGEEYQSAATSIAIGLGVALPLAAAVTAAAPGSVIAALNASEVAFETAADALVAAGAASATTGGTAAAEAAAAGVDAAISGAAGLGAAAVSVVLLAVVSAVIEGINVVNAANLPGELASLIASTETPPAGTFDPANVLATTGGGTTLYSLFVGATLPTPLNETCDNTPQVIGSSNLGPVYGTAGNCLNPTPIPPASPSDPLFLVQAPGSSTPHTSPTITWTDAASGTTTTARLHETWFIENESVQTLHITYTDWNGNEQNAWLLGNPTDGYEFLNFSAPTGASTSVDPSTCVADGTCSYSTSIDYVDNGQDYSASVQGYVPSVGAPTYSTAVEGSPITFNANGFAPANATGPVTYAWEFELTCPGNCTVLPVNGQEPYSSPVSGATVGYTWQKPGVFDVSLTATDATGTQVNDTFTVTVADVPPTLVVLPTCGAVTISCTPQTGVVGTPMGVTGTVTHTGNQDAEDVTVNWGDGTSTDYAETGGLLIDANNIVVTPQSDTSFTFSDTHSYAEPGTYIVTVTVSDGAGNGASQTFTDTIQGLQSIEFPSVPPQTYGGAPFTISATGGGSGQAVTFAVTSGSSVCSLSGATSGTDASGNGTGTANVTVLAAGTCAITARQAGAGALLAAPSVTQSFTVEPAPLAVTASSPSITYGASVPAITPSYTGFVNGDSASSLTTQPTCTVAPNSGAAGNYQTTCTGAVDPNYSLSYVPGTLTIAQAPLTITANNESMVYGGPVPTFAASFSGLVNGDTSSTISGLTCGAVDGSNDPVSGSTPAGTYTITCSGGTTANYSISYQPGTLTISKANTAINLASVPASSVFGQPVTIAAYIAVQSPGAGNPSGTVAFQDGGTDISGCSAQPVSTTTETASCTTSSLSVATHSITATYSGDSDFNGSSATAPLSQPVTKAGSAITLGAPAPITLGQAATFTAGVTAAAPGAGTPTGTVTFYNGTTRLGTSQLSGSNGTDRATFSTSSLGVGAHTITASYGGDGNFTANSTAAVTEYVNTNLSGYPKLSNGAYNLSNANLKGAYFVDVSLAGAQLNNANLAGAVLIGANLTGATLANSNLNDANLANANLTSANLTLDNLAGANLTGATLSDANLSGATLSGANLTGATLTGANLTAVNLSGANLSDANLSGTDLTLVTLGSVNLSGVNLSHSNLTAVNLSGANLSNANLTDATLALVNLAGANLSGATLTGATGLKTATLKNVVWSDTTCPDGTNSNNEGGSCVGHF